MKVSIEKLPHGVVKVVLVTGADKPPIQVQLNPGQLNSLLSLLEAARQAERFKFELEL